MSNRIVFCLLGLFCWVLFSGCPWSSRGVVPQTASGMKKLCIPITGDLQVLSEQAYFYFEPESGVSKGAHAVYINKNVYPVLDVDACYKVTIVSPLCGRLAVDGLFCPKINKQIEVKYLSRSVRATLTVWLDCASISSGGNIIVFAREEEPRVILMADDIKKQASVIVYNLPPGKCSLYYNSKELGLLKGNVYLSAGDNDLRLSEMTRTEVSRQ